MNSNEEKIRAAIAEQAGEWFVTNDEGPLDARDSAALAAWFKTSPVHIEEFLGVSTVARDLKHARTDPEYSLEAILARARADDLTVAQRPWPGVTEAARGRPFRGWRPAAAALAAVAVLSIGLLLTLSPLPNRKDAAPAGIAALHFETRHGEQLTQRLPDDSVLHLNTDSAVSIRYSTGERLVILDAGQAAFEVTHEADRAFRVQAGSAEIVDVGTKFDVRLEQGSTLVTVVEGRVDVGMRRSEQRQSPPFIELRTDQQIRVTDGAWPARPVAVDATGETAWLHRQIIFHNEKLGQVVAEFNRYSAKPIEIATPALRNLEISGVFATDDTAAFIAFLRSLEGVKVEVTETKIRVTRNSLR
jgi:transmembrane sensor